MEKHAVSAPLAVYCIYVRLGWLVLVCDCPSCIKHEMSVNINNLMGREGFAHFSFSVRCVCVWESVRASGSSQRVIKSNGNKSCTVLEQLGMYEWMCNSRWVGATACIGWSLQAKNWKRTTSAVRERCDHFAKSINTGMGFGKTVKFHWLPHRFAR